MFYGYDPADDRGYVRAIWDGPPSDEQRAWARDDGEQILLEVLEVDHPTVPDERFWRVSAGQLVECIGPPEEDQARRHRRELAREERQRKRDASTVKVQRGRGRRVS